MGMSLGGGLQPSGASAERLPFSKSQDGQELNMSPASAQTYMTNQSGKRSGPDASNVQKCDDLLFWQRSGRNARRQQTGSARFGDAYVLRHITQLSMQHDKFNISAKGLSAKGRLTPAEIKSECFHDAFRI
ncbi:hypothetical protein GGTG_05857 [Gaeumannomyces tritici R3-111a-1]|uniref:Uncharacterized protein n=1 Tax=Gaeumannomyces tritici (strain R3-111a-1) TaxID=644352 RepID=J3NX50_GAET3|nr:hypothetical protein GGTG_05857 [Gaeumannomyces tritici R3-111a-1]EJT75932.1 hypothetical protein GGTG_05857 [Gaeumannomyces tritici R3-111a-1]